MSFHWPPYQASGDQRSRLRPRERTACWQLWVCILFTWPGCSTTRHDNNDPSDRCRSAPDVKENRLFPKVPFINGTLDRQTRPFHSFPCRANGPPIPPDCVLPRLSRCLPPDLQEPPDAPTRCSAPGCSRCIILDQDIRSSSPCAPRLYPRSTDHFRSRFPARRMGGGGTVPGFPSRGPIPVEKVDASLIGGRTQRL